METEFERRIRQNEGNGKVLHSGLVRKWIVEAGIDLWDHWHRNSTHEGLAKWFGERCDKKELTKGERDEEKTNY